MQAAVEEARKGRTEGGIPIGAVLVHDGEIIGRGHNRRVQMGSAIRHGETDALENAGRLPARVYRDSVMYTTLSPCAMCTGAVLLYGIGEVVVGENRTFLGEEGPAGRAGREGDRARRRDVRGHDGGVHRGRARPLERGHRRGLTLPAQSM